MFVLTLKTRLIAKKRFLMLVCILFAVLMIIAFCAVLMIAKPADTAFCDSVGEYSLVADSDESIAEFASQFSHKLDELYSARRVYIPSEFDDTYTQYNKVQKKQGLDLEQYKGRGCSLYVYRLKDYKIDYEDTYITIIVYKDRVIGGHISTAVANSPMYTFFGE